MTARIALVRHPAAAIAAGHCYGRCDLDLAPGFEAAIERIRQRTAALRPARIWSSPARRCRMVADALAGDSPVHVDARLQELDFGAWEGRAWADIPRAELERWAADPEGYAPGGGEAPSSMVARVSAACADLLRDPGDLIVVTHGGPLRILAALLRGRRVDVRRPAPPPGSVRIVIRHAGSPAR